MGNADKVRADRRRIPRWLLPVVAMLLFPSVFFAWQQNCFAPLGWEFEEVKIRKLRGEIGNVFGLLGIRKTNPDIPAVPVVAAAKPWKEKLGVIEEEAVGVALSNPVEAISLYKEIIQFLSGETQSDNGVIRELCRIHIALGRVFLEQERPEEAVAEFDKAIGMFESNRKNLPQADWLEIAKIQVAAGELYLNRLNRSELSLSYFESSVEVMDLLLKNSPGEGDLLQQAVSIYEQAGHVFWNPGHREKAGENYRKLAALANRYPKQVGDTVSLASVLMRLGSIAEQKGDLAEARIDFAKALDIRKRLYSGDSDHTGYRKELGESGLSLAMIDFQKGDRASAARILSEYRELIAEDFDAVERMAEVANVFVVSGEVLLDDRKREDAVKLIQKANDLKQKAADREPGNAGYRRGAMLSHLKLGELYEGLGNYDRALDHYILFVSEVHGMEVDKLASESDVELLNRHLKRIVDLRKNGFPVRE
ncbi:MAG: tetratricopeptide repeat protein [Verrucomicrobiales bacterium]|nr:tetratricopeptide repeat protein [Verrucomicrobiales bacterium]